MYCISSLGVTGEKSSFVTNFDEFVGTIKKYTDVPACVGFGVSNGKQVKELTKYFDGAIVGSAIEKIVAQYGVDSPEHVYEYVKSMSEAVAKAAAEA